MTKVYKFDNNLRLVHKYIPTVRSVSAGIFVGVGSVLECNANNGISHFIEHMLFKGTQKRSAFEIAESVDRLGGQINAYTSKELTAYYTISIDENLDGCVDILSDLFFNSVFCEKEIEREKGVVKEEISMTNDTPDDLALELLFSAYFKGHCLERPILGTKTTVEAFSRNDIVDYMAQHYVSGDIVVSICGNITYENAITLVEKYFARNFKNDSKSNNFLETPHTPKPIYTHKFKDLEQANICYAFPAYKFDSGNEKCVQILSTIFGGGMSSRLFQTIREKLGLCYSVFSFPSTYRNNGALSIYLGTNTDTSKAAIEGIKKEIIKLKSDGITQIEFEKAINQIKSSMILGEESSAMTMRANGKYMLMTDKIYNIDKRLEEINKITIKQINDVINEIFVPDKMCASYVGKEIDFNPLNMLEGI